MALTPISVVLTLPQFTGSLLLNILLTLGISIALLFLSTYLITTIQFHLKPLPNAQDGGKRPPSPPTLPYHLPYLGSAFSMATNAHTFYQHLNRVSLSSHHAIIGVRTGPLYSYFTTGSSNILTMFKHSRIMSTEEIFLDVNRFVAGIGRKDAQIFTDDESGPYAKPLELPRHGGKGKEGAPRIWRAIHEAHLNVQSGKALSVLSAVFTKEFQWVLDGYEKDLQVKGQGAEAWETTTLFNGFFKNKMSTATGRALMGTEIFNYESDLVAVFWGFFDGFLPLFFGMPRIMYPRIYAARDRLHTAFLKMLKRQEGIYEELHKKDVDWIEELGGRINRSRDEAHRDSGISLEGRAQLMSSFLIGIMGNAVPIAGWMLLELVQRPSLLEAVREEVLTAITSSPSDLTSPEFDLTKLTTLPLLSSLWLECLRLRMSTVPFRKLLTPLEVGGYKLEAGYNMMIPTSLAHTEPTFWTQSGHPPEELWPERFVGKDEKELEGHFLPFGGGTHICPGRFFARQEVLLAVAMMVLRFEIELVGFVELDGHKRSGKPESDVRTAGASAMMPDGDCLVRMRRRKA